MSGSCRNGPNSQHAAGSPSPLGPPTRRSMTPTRLFTHQIECIIKDNEKQKPHRPCGLLPEGHVPVQAEVSGRSPPYGSPMNPPHAPLDFLLEREEPSGAEDDSEGAEGMFETILVKVEDCPVEDASKTALKKESVDLSPISATSDHLDSLPRDLFKVEVKVDVKVEKKEKRHDDSSYRDDNSSGPEEEETMTIKRKKVKKERKSSSSKEMFNTDFKHSSRQSKRHCQRKVKSSSRVKKRQSSPKCVVAEEKLCKTPVEPDTKSNFICSAKPMEATHYTTNDLDSCSSRSSSRNMDGNTDTPVKTGDHCKSLYGKIVHHNLPLMTPFSKMSSSESYVDEAVSSNSDDEVIDHKIYAVPDRDVMSTSCSLESRSDSDLKKSSSATDRIPFSGSSCFSSLRPDVPYRLPSTPTSSVRFGSSQVSNNQSPSMQTSSYTWMTQPPPPPPPSMFRGVFQWREYPDSPASAHSPSTPNFSPLSLTPTISPYHSLNSSPYLDHTPNMFAPTRDPDRRFQRLQNLHFPPRPSFHGYQLIGDSMLLRFSQQIIGENAIVAESLRFLGYCVSGQKVGDLLKRLKSGFYHLGNKVILMIGTNDLLRNTNSDQMCNELRRVVDHIRSVAEQLVVLTLPPVPRLEKNTCHWHQLNKYNDFIKQLAKRDRDIKVFDISPLYVLTQEELEVEELLARFSAEGPFCRGCLTCLEESEDIIDDCSSLSDEDDMADASMLARVYISTSPPVVTSLDICNLFVDMRIPKCRMDLFELTFSDSERKDLIHLNKKGLTVVKEQLYKVL